MTPYDSYLDLPVCRQSQPIARPTEVVGHAADEPETAYVTWYDVRAGGVIQLIGSFPQLGIAFLYESQQFRGGNHFGLVPSISCIMSDGQPG